MKFKSLITTTVAIGILASTGANFNQGHANTSSKVPTASHQSNINKNYNILYNIDVDGTSLYKLSSFSFSKKEPRIGYSKLTQRVKEALKYYRGINENKLRSVHKATYTVHFKNGTKRVINLKSNINTADLINIYDVKTIDINVKTKDASKVKENYVPYTISVDGIINNALTNFKFSNKSKFSYDDLTLRIKEALRYDRGINENKLRNVYKATYTVYFKNGTKKVVNLNSNLYIGELINSKNIKKIDINIKTKKVIKATYVPYTIAVNGTSALTLSKLKFTGDSRVSYGDITKKVKSVLKYDRGISDIDLKLAKQATYTVYFKNGTKKVIDLKSNIYTANLFNVKDIKKIDINVKKHVKSNKKHNKVIEVKIPVTINGYESSIKSPFVFSNGNKITLNDLSIKLKSALANEAFIKSFDLNISESAKYKVYFKDGSSKYVDLKSNVQHSKVFKATDIKSINVELKF
ncbi:TPA: MAP domain-containing protein [Staphylococcus aureus]